MGVVESEVRGGELTEVSEVSVVRTTMSEQRWCTFSNEPLPDATTIMCALAASVCGGQQKLRATTSSTGTCVRACVCACVRVCVCVYVCARVCV